MIVQRVADMGVKDQQWVVGAEGPLMRLDIPLLVPHLLQLLKTRKRGKLVAH